MSLINVNSVSTIDSSAGFNAWANSQGYAPRPFKQRDHLIQPYNMGLYSLCRIGWFIFSGKSAWFISRLINLLSVPGLERNLRIIIDWFLVLAFRSDIAILAQTASTHLQRSHFKEGDEVFRQGDAAEMAYVVESGRLKVIQDRRKIRELGPGDYFGEIMPTHLNRRMETVRCLSDCELKIVSQEDLQALIKSGWLMGKAIRNLSDYQSMAANAELSLGIKRLTYVSKLNAILDEEKILEIGRISSLNNRKIDVTGVLISVRDYFFQVLEGEEAIVDALVEKITRDPRHHQLTILSSETGCEERLFTDWGMKTVALSESNDLMLLAIGMMLQNIAQSYNIVGRYTQPVLLKHLMEGINPLTIPVKSTEKIVVSGSMTDFLTLSQRFAVEELIDVINNYLEICSTSFIEYGGQVAKYFGGCIIAHFPPNEVDASIAACVDALRRLQALPTMFRTINYGFGLASGAMIEGNIGSSIKMDYTVLGNTVNQAVNLGVLARDLNKAIAVNESIQLMAAPSWCFEQVEEFAFKEPNVDTQVYTLADVSDSRQSGTC